MQKRQVVKHTATWDPSQAGAQYDPSQNANRDYANGAEGSYNQFIHGKYVGTGTIGPSVWSAMNSPTGGGSPGAGMFAAGGGDLRPGPDGKSTYRYDMGEKPNPDMHIYHNGDPKGDETNIDHEGKVRTGNHHGRGLKNSPKKLRSPYRSVIKTFLERAGMAADAITEVLDGITLDIPIFTYYDPTSIHHTEVNGIDISPHG